MTHLAGLYRQPDGCSHNWKSIYILRVAAGPAAPLSTNTGVSKVFFDEWKRRVVERNLYGPTEPYSMVMNDSKSIIARLPFGIRRIWWIILI